MRFVARPLHDHPVELVPAPTSRAWTGGSGVLFADPTLQAATSRGWDLLCPYTFEATWNGGDAPDDVQIDVPGFAVSEVGYGVLTLQTGYEIELGPGYDLWVRGPINAAKDGIQPLDQVIEADLLPYVLTVNWRFSQPGQTVRFERGEPFATILPYPSGLLAQTELEIAPPEPTDLPGISCICPTYGRPELLEEAIESFLRQQYAGPKELLVLNDLDAQILVFEHPDVRIVNVPKRFRTLGEKLNAAVGLCTYDIVAVWHDDDVSLPHRLAVSAARLDPAVGFFKSSRAFFWNDGVISGPDANVFHGGSLWTRSLFAAARGYPHLTDGVDQAAERSFALASLDAGASSDLPLDEEYLFYRWNGTDSYHLSALQTGPGDPHGAYDAVAAYVAQGIAEGRIRTGLIELQPHWRRPYDREAQAYVEAHTTQASPEALELASHGSEPSASAANRDEHPAERLPIVFESLPRPVPESEALALFQDTHERRISVVLPACNEWPLLQRTLDQFRVTLPPGSEIVVVDNGSTDG